MKHKAFILFLLFLGVMPLVSTAQAEKEKSSGTVSLQVDNDAFVGTDRDYTSGVRLIWISPDLTGSKENSRLPKWIYSLSKLAPFANRPGFQNYVSFSIAQSVYTPYDIRRADLIEDDRPYAGMLCLGIAFHSRGKRSMDTLEFELGIVGPHSFAGQFQKLVHRMFNWAYPMGWDNQLKDEPALEAIYDRKWKLLRSSDNCSFGCDLIPHTKAGLGNVYIGAGAGVGFRFGWNLPDDFGTSFFGADGRSKTALDRGVSRGSSGRWFGIHVFAAVDGQGILRDIFLDGSTFRDSHRVEKKAFIADVSVGAAVVAGQFKVSYRQVYQSKRFETQGEKQVYGQIILSFSY